MLSDIEDGISDRIVRFLEENREICKFMELLHTSSVVEIPQYLLTPVM